MVPSASVNFELNGERREVETQLTVHSLLHQFDLLERRVAVAINTEVVPKSRFDTAVIREGDRVEVIQAVGGG